MKNIIFDHRWSGTHGIGRFSDELCKRVKFNRFYKSNGSPAKLISSLKFWTWSLTVTNLTIFTPGYIPPITTRAKYYFTIHDLNHIDTNYNSSIIKKIFYNLIIKPATKRAEKIFTVSEFSKSRIIEWSKCDPNKVIVVGNGVSKAFSPSATAMNAPFKYIFCCSNRKKHKNEERLIRAFATSESQKNIKLVLTGVSTPEINILISKLKIDDSVIFTGKLSEHELASWYRGAIATIFPSLYEGFGLPIIESMSCGTPVITSNTTSLPEVGGDACMYIDPFSIASISKAIDLISTDDSLREKLIARGLDRSQLYSWEKTASAIIENIS